MILVAHIFGSYEIFDWTIICIWNALDMMTRLSALYVCVCE